MDNALYQEIINHLGWGQELSGGEFVYVYPNDEGEVYPGEDIPVGKFYPDKLIQHAKLIQAQLVKEGWRITIKAFPSGSFEVSALQYDSPDAFVLSGEPNEPAAIVELACKVWEDNQ